MSHLCLRSALQNRPVERQCLLNASLEVIGQRHGVWWLMPDSKFPVPSHPVQVSGSRAWNDHQGNCRYAFVESAAMLKHKGPGAATNTAHHSLQTDEAGRAVVAVHH